MCNRLAATRWKALIILMAGLLILLPATAMGMLRASWDITDDGETKTYTYHFVNDIEPTHRVDTIFIGISEAGLRSITSVSMPDFAYELNYNAEELVVLQGVGSQGYLDFQLTTPANVPTDYAREDQVGLGAWNWYYTMDVNGHGEWGFADSPLPVPAGVVPEPSSLAVLGLTISGAVAALIRRRRS